MKTTIITGHPYQKSFNHHLVQILLTQEATQVIDLIADDFNPVMKAEDLAGYAKGEATDPLVLKYQAILSETERLVIVMPIWWSNLPAIYKGFFDKVMLKHFAYEETAVLHGKLTHIREVLLVTTSQAPTWYLRLFAGDPIVTFKRRVLKDLGLTRVSWYNLGRIKNRSQIKRAQFSDKILKLVGDK